jgi:hypothetical protein
MNANLWRLPAVASLPFPTRLLAEAIRDPRADAVAGADAVGLLDRTKSPG